MQSEIESSSLTHTTRIHYKIFHNVFLYITENCQLKCGHCYMGQRLTQGNNLSLDDAKLILHNCRKLGSQQITLLGGEPTLHPDFVEIINYSKQVGFDKIIVDSNGLFIDPFKIISPDNLEYVSVSLDGSTAELHDKVRGQGTFEKTIKNIREIMKMGFRVRINYTVFNFNVEELRSILTLAEDLGVSLLNFHSFFEEGTGGEKTNWSLTPKVWISFCHLLQTIKKEFKVDVWYPPTWIYQNELEYYIQKGFHGCLGLFIDRLSIFPDGKCYICSLLFDEPLNFLTMNQMGTSLNINQNEYDIFQRALFRANNIYEIGCPAEEIAKTKHSSPATENIFSICRCWKCKA